MKLQTPLSATKYRATDANLVDAGGRAIATMSMADAVALMAAANFYAGLLAENAALREQLAQAAVVPA